MDSALTNLQRLICHKTQQTKPNIQGPINKIRNSVGNRQSWIAWQTVNEVSKRKGTSRAKLKAASQEEQILMWKEHFKNLLGKSPKVTAKTHMKINYQLDIKLGQFTQEELDVVLTKINNRKVASLDEIPPKVWKTRKFDNPLLQYCNAIYK